MAKTKEQKDFERSIKHREFKVLRRSLKNSNPDFNDPKYCEGCVNGAQVSDSLAEDYKKKGPEYEKDVKGCYRVAGMCYLHAAYHSIVQNDLRSAAHYYRKASIDFAQMSENPNKNWEYVEAVEYYKVIRTKAAKRILFNRKLRKFSLGLLGRVEGK